MTTTGDSAFSLPSDFTALMSLASQILTEDGSIRLGCFVTALKKGTTKVKYGACVSKHWKSFSGFNDKQFRHIYELALRHLELTHGPLICQATSYCADHVLVWGYADVRCGTCGHGALTQPQAPTTDWSKLRIRALNAGHPDAPRRPGAVQLPDSTWQLACRPQTQVVQLDSRAGDLAS